MNELMDLFYRTDKVKKGMIGKKVWFSFKDVCEFLEIEEDCIEILDADERMFYGMVGSMEMFVNEYELCNLIFQSDIEMAKKFQKDSEVAIKEICDKNPEKIKDFPEFQHLFKNM